MSNTLPLLIIAGGTFAFYARRSLRYLQYFQQEEYNDPRYRAWLTDKKAFDKKGSLLLAVLLVFYTLFGTDGGVWRTLLAIAGAFALWVVVYRLEEDPRTTGKISLKMTERATRIWKVSLALFGFTLLVLTVLFISSFSDTSLAWFYVLQILLIQTTPVWILFSNRLLDPYEKRHQQQFVEEAKAILNRVDPYIIGITGSYGKTSVKLFLGELLTTAVAPTFYPPKSYNTVMGVTREIRNRLKPGYKYFLSEMGAYQIGSIKKLCEFTPPRSGIVTAVGLSHLDRFGSAENIYAAKSELPQAVPDDGIMLYNGDNPGARKMAEQYPKATTLIYGLDPSIGKLDASLSDLSMTTAGTHFTFNFRGRQTKGFTKLVGKAALSNLLASLTMATQLGADPEYLLAAAGSLEPVDNRLALVKRNGIYFLNDAYNSNPAGFEAALELLKDLPADRKVLMTPGMIELGHRQFEENERMGRIAGEFVKLAIVVGPTNREALVGGLEAGGLGRDFIVTTGSREEAFKVLGERQQTGDIILIENDLPDLYEGNTSF